MAKVRLQQEWTMLLLHTQKWFRLNATILACHESLANSVMSFFLLFEIKVRPRLTYHKGPLSQCSFWAVWYKCSYASKAAKQLFVMLQRLYINYYFRHVNVLCVWSVFLCWTWTRGFQGTWNSIQRLSMSLNMHLEPEVALTFANDYSVKSALEYSIQQNEDDRHYNGA